MARRRFRSVVARVAGVSILAQIPACLTASALAAWLLPVPWPWSVLGVVVVMGVLNTPFARWIVGGIDDHERSLAYLWGIELPFYIQWAASFVFAPAAGVVVVADLALDAFVGRELGLPYVALWVMLGVSVAIAAYAVLFRRLRPVVTRTEVPVQGLPDALDGYTIVQLSDLHIGGLTPVRRGKRWTAIANGLGADLAVVTGDLIAHGDAFIDGVAEVLASLQAPDGVYACMGNHDYFCDGERLASAIEATGVNVLRNEGKLLTTSRGGSDAPLFVAGIDDTWSRRDDMDLAMRDHPGAGVPSVLLAHDPAVFPGAVERGVSVMLAGHTHGGQVAIPFAARRWNLARLHSAFTSGLYRVRESSLYVHRGNGTTGPPLRLGSAPEIALLVLRPVS